MAGLRELHRSLRPGGRLLIWDTDFATVPWYSDDSARMTRVVQAWNEHLAHPSFRGLLAPAIRSVGFDRLEMHPHGFVTAIYHPDTFSVASIPVIRSFVSDRRRVSKDEAAAWANELKTLGEQGRYYFAYLQFAFVEHRPS